MKKYKIVIEAAFVSIAGSEARECHGFFSTFNIHAINAKNAMHHVGILLSQRMNKNHVLERREGVLKTRYIVHDIWEVEADAGVDEVSERDDGFTFFRMTLVATIVALVRYSFVLYFKPHLVVLSKYD